MNVEKKILIVDDDETMQMILSDILTSHGYNVHLASNGSEALKLHRQFSYPVIISDLEMPLMNGFELINNLKKTEDEAILIVLTVNEDPRKIIEIMKMDIYDYILKPVVANDISFKVNRALETAELRKIKKVMEKERQAKIMNQLEWYRYTDNISKKKYQRFDRTLFKSLHTSFTKGAGIGTILTLLKIISETAERQDGNYLIDGDLFDVVNENAKIAETAINAFSNVSRIINDTVIMETLTLNNLFQQIQLCVREIKKYTEIENHKIIVNEPKDSFGNVYIRINSDQIMTAVKELLINAMKFSPQSSSIMIIIEAIDDNVEITVINTPVKQIEGVNGIPEDYERVVFEPFYRMSKEVSMNYDSLDYGLGLSLVEIIIQKHSGSIQAGNVKDYSIYHNKVEERVTVTMQLPQYNEMNNNLTSSSEKRGGKKFAELHV